MRIFLLIFFITTILFQAQAQTDTVYAYGDSTHIDVQPEFPGGDAGFMNYILNRVIYPEDAKVAGLQGTVFMSFIIEKDGSVSSFKPLAGLYVSESCDKEVIRVLSQSPRWKPGLKDGVPIRTKKISRIKFSLAGSTSAVTTSGEYLKKIDEANENTVFRSVSAMPAYRTTNGSLFKFIKDSLNYPADAKENKITGSVIVSFIVEKDGTVSNIKIIKGLYPSCDQAALDLVSRFPAWVPGDHKGTYVRVLQMVRIMFE